MKLNTLKEILEALHDDGICYENVNVNVNMTIDNMTIEKDKAVYENEFTVNFILTAKRLNMFAKQHRIKPTDFGLGGPRFSARIKMKDNMYLDRVRISVNEEDIETLADNMEIEECQAKKIIDSIISVLEYDIFIILKED
jgi:hypothetical protein